MCMFYMYLCMCVHMYVHTIIYIHMYIHTETHRCSRDEGQILHRPESRVIATVLKIPSKPI